MSDIPIIGEADESKYEEQLSNAYHFGQFFALHTALRIKDIYGLERAYQFMESRYKTFTREFPNFYNQMIKVDKEASRRSEEEYKKFLENQLKDEQG
jgi:hypothetical protein